MKENNTYSSVIEYLYSQLPMYQNIGKKAFKKDLTNITKLCNHLGNPHTQFKSIHIAGTNGKGSTANAIASVFQASTYKVGLYTSPHYIDFRERIRINGEMISEEAVISFVEKNKPLIQDIQPSFFEITVAMAFDYFARQKVDIAIIETGLGGRLDSTNVIQPVLSVITNINYDHTDILGDTLEKIAFEKAGIIKPNTPVVIGEKKEATKQVFEKKADETNSKLFFVEDNIQIHTQNTSTDLVNIFDVYCENKNWINSIKTDILGKYQISNLRTCLGVCRVLQKKWQLNDDFIRNGLQNIKNNTNFIGRMQLLDFESVVIVDSAHNEQGIQELLMSLLQHTKPKNITFILGFVKGKNVSEMLKLFPKKSKIIATEPKINRKLPFSHLSEIMKQQNIKHTKISSVKIALDAVLPDISTDELVCITGSSFLVAEAVNNCYFKTS